MANYFPGNIFRLVTDVVANVDVLAAPPPPPPDPWDPCGGLPAYFCGFGN